MPQNATTFALVGASKSKMNITAASVVKATPGRCVRIVIVNPGSAGSITINDCATTGTAAAANEFFTTSYNATGVQAGTVISLDWPCGTGIVVSAIPTGGVVSIAYS